MLDQLIVIHPSFGGCGGETRVWTQARVGVDLENPGLARLIDAKIDPGIAAKLKQLPTLARELAHATDERTIAGGELIDAWRVFVFERTFVELGRVADNPRLASGKRRKVNFRRRQ